MRHILIDRARQRRALKHGGDQQRVDIQEIEIPVNKDDDDQVIAMSEAIDKLAREHPEIAELVKLRCFVGLEVRGRAGPRDPAHDGVSALDVRPHVAVQRADFLSDAEVVLPQGGGSAAGLALSPSSVTAT